MTGAGTTSALTWLITRTARNRARSQVARLRNIRYLFGLFFIVVYVVFAIRPQRFFEGGPAVAGEGAVLGPGLATAIALGLLLLVLRWWVFGGRLTTLAFSRSETQFLLPAPLSRARLISYKLARAHLAIVASALIISVVTARSAALPAPLRFLSYVVLFGTLQLHQLAATLTRSGGRPVGSPVGRRGCIVGVAALALVALTIGVSVAQVWPSLNASGDVGGWLGRLGAALDSRPASFLLAPFRTVLAPLSSASLGEWSLHFPLALAIMLAHYPWILATKAPFEEAAVAAGDRREKLRAASRRSGGGGGGAVLDAVRAMEGKKPLAGRSPWFPLAPEGRPWVAILWKNAIAVTRQLRWTTLIVSVLGVAVIGAVVVYARYSRGVPIADAILDVRYGIALGALGFAALSVLVGPLYARNDFRSDLPYLRVLRTYPLSSAGLVGAEILASAATLFGFQLAMLAIAWLLPGGDEVPSFAMRTGLFVAALLVAAVLDVLGVAVRNAVALFFPGWVKLGSDGGGVEAVGYNVLGTAGAFLLLALLLVVPVGAAVAVAVATSAYEVSRGASVAGASATLAVFLILVALELLLLFRGLGTVYEDIDAGELLEQS